MMTLVKGVVSKAVDANLKNTLLLEKSNLLYLLGIYLAGGVSELHPIV